MPPVLVRHADKIDLTIIAPGSKRPYRTNVRMTGFLCAIGLSVTLIAKWGNKKNGDKSNHLLFYFCYKSINCNFMDVCALNVYRVFAQAKVNIFL